MEAIQIAIDGPAGAGKSTIAKELAYRLDYTYIDTGAMYRALTYAVLKENVKIDDIPQILEVTRNTEMSFKKGNIFINDILVNNEVRSIVVSQNVSYIARIPEIREILVDIQRRIASNQNVVMDGRDIGTKVLPDAKLKIFLTASVEERANRRYSELILKGLDVNLNDIKEEIITRDKMDEERSCSPLKAADDSIKIDTTDKTVEEVIRQIIFLLNERI
ncbi:(d)CMP kinase [Alkaliphilus peptidifermentans]|uniref:Cytidylate kinase n=1 Tax=Alkaliphilus peptidifermentans DSM 18978 TaxID=1120976 RepID=A0A1G5KMB8_9FIRM|nr:(d)CMP kinase [Alkaliphilus peptidifermentans]SCZ01341.1 cytidylate kinase [Alkaliphilus peptidifermentans DSM 18978]